jgi:UDP-glucose 4-epimerase
MNILVTGGAGYIGSHTCVAAIEAGHRVAVLDNLSNASEESLNRVENITGTRPRFIKADLLDRAAVKAVFDSEEFGAVIHFAGLKAVGESVRKPWEYFHNNIEGTLVLLDEMRNHGVFNLVFSSSATVYGNPRPEDVPLREDAPLSAVSPYGRTKLWIEDMLRDMAAADPRWHSLLLRYFNPVGAHPSGLMGEDPAGIPNNLMPFITQVAVGRLETLSVFGDDYPTRDGSCVRDYIHVCDLAEGHVAALGAIGSLPGATPVNLGTGAGFTVLEIVRAFEKAYGKALPYKIAPRRAGDAAVSFADASRAARLFGWTAKRGIGEICRDGWNWQAKNPQGYGAPGR